MSFPKEFDTDAVAIITGGASGIGLDAATRCVAAGMRVAVLDVSEKELSTAEAALKAKAAGPSHVTGIKCDVTKVEDCTAAFDAVKKAFPGKGVSFLFNNAGIMGGMGLGVLKAEADDWRQIFNVNVLGAANIIRTWVPELISAGPLPSGKPTFVVTTSSAAGLFNNTTGPYQVSKMAVTALSEHLTIEVGMKRDKAKHISVHSLHPSMVGTAFYEQRAQDGSKTAPGTPALAMMKSAGILTAEQTVDGLFEGIDAGKGYISVQGPGDAPFGEMIEKRMREQMTGAKPKLAQMFGVMKTMMGGGVSKM